MSNFILLEFLYKFYMILQFNYIFSIKLSLQQ